MKQTQRRRAREREGGEEQSQSKADGTLGYRVNEAMNKVPRANTK